MQVAPVPLANPSNPGTKEGYSPPSCSLEVGNNLCKIILLHDFLVSSKSEKMRGQQSVSPQLTSLTSAVWPMSISQETGKM